MDPIRSESSEHFVRIGTSAWSYDDWKGAFYPEHLPATDRLPFYAKHFPTVEIDSTFYHTPAAHVAAHWASVTPWDFTFAAKLSREITHERRLRDCDALLDEFLAGIRPLGRKLACVLVQLPPSFDLRHDERALRDFVHRLPPSVRFAVEFRDPSWHLPRVAHLLEESQVCWVWNDISTADHASEAAFGSYPRTADFLYLRLMGDLDTKYDEDGERVHRYRELLWPRDAAMDSWAERVRAAFPEVARAYVYAANHFEGFAPQSAARIARRFGLEIALPSAAELSGDDPRQLGLL